MSSSVKKIGYPFMESKICETGWCHCSHETRCQIMVQNVSELSSKSVNRAWIQGGETHRKPK